MNETQSAAVAVEGAEHIIQEAVKEEGCNTDGLVLQNLPLKSSDDLRVLPPQL